MKQTFTLTELKKLQSVKEVSQKSITIKGGQKNKTSNVIPFITGIISHSLGFIPPPGI